MRVDQIHPGDTKSIEAVPGVIVNPATDHEHVAFGCCCELDHRTDHLAAERGRIDPALTGDDEVGVLDLVVQVDGVGDQGRTRLESSPGSDETTSESTRRSPTLDPRNIGPVLGPVHVDQAFKPSGEQTNLSRTRTLLRPEHPSCVREARLDIAGDDQIHPTQP